jgi:hypothetical protein
MADRENNGGSVSHSKVGLSMINVLSNVAYAGMRAQGSKDTLSRFLSFWGGFPGTLFTYFIVE